jgi:argininosuccinate lyase
MFRLSICHAAHLLNERLRTRGERLWTGEMVVKNQQIRLWGGRFQKPPNGALMALSSAATLHARLIPFDILGSIAHAQVLYASHILSTEDRDCFVTTLREIQAKALTGELAPETFDEDIHTFLERVLVERLGSFATKLRTGRSRNDQAANDLKLYLRATAPQLAIELSALAGALAKRAQQFAHTVCPGFTHLQIAQPITFGHLLMAHAQPLARNMERLRDWHMRSSECPLGAAALAGSTFPGDEAATARTLFVSAMVTTDLSRLCEEVTIWSSRQFSWISIDDGFATGSSIMPQKKNPDIAEIARGRAARLIGDLVTMLTALKGLPLAYNRDLAEDKRAAFDACDVLAQILPALTGLIETMVVDRGRLAADAAEGYALATELADYLAEKGVPFAEAHEISGSAVLYAEKRRLRLDQLSADDFVNIDARIKADALLRLTPEVAIASRNGIGGTAPASVLVQIDRFQKRVAELLKWANKTKLDADRS